MTSQSVGFTTPAGRVSGIVDGPDDADDVLVLAHGAGAGMDSDFMGFVSVGIARDGIAVYRFNFPYMQAGKKSPDRQPVLEETFGAVVKQVRETARPSRLFLGGKSLGGRIASHVVAAGLPADGLVFLGYPLHPPGKPERLRAEHLHEIGVPMLFVEGTRDPFCPLDALRAALAGVPAPTEVAVVDEGDHSLKVRSSSGRTTTDAWSEAVDHVVGWIAVSGRA